MNFLFRNVIHSFCKQPIVETVSTLHFNSFSTSIRFLSTQSKVQLISKQILKRPKDSLKTEIAENHANSFYKVSGFAFGENFDFKKLKNTYQNDENYSIVELPTDFNDGMVITSKSPINEQPKDIFIFRNGSVVTWNISENELKSIEERVSHSLLNPYPDEIIKSEMETFQYLSQKDSKTQISLEEIIILNECDRKTNILEKFSFSDALGLSVKLGVLESQMEDLATVLEPMIETLKTGRLSPFLTKKSLLKVTGELFTLKHLINVELEMFRSPDTYWDYTEVEVHFARMKRVLQLESRCKDLNGKLDLCCEFMELLSNHLHEKRSIRLEIMIVFLILVEVIFQIYPPNAGHR